MAFGETVDGKEANFQHTAERGRDPTNDEPDDAAIDVPENHHLPTHSLTRHNETIEH